MALSTDIQKFLALNPQYAAIITAMNYTATDPETLRARLMAIAEALQPGLSTDFPGTLIEDIASTDMGAASQADSAIADLYGSFSPTTTNAQFLAGWGQLIGRTRGYQTNAYAYLNLTGTPGLYIAKGFQFSDGMNIYQTTQSAVLDPQGNALGIFVRALAYFEETPAANSINQLVSGILASQTLTATNPEAGTAAVGMESDASFRMRLWNAMQATATGVPTLIRDYVSNVPGVIDRTVRIIATEGAFMIMAAGGAPGDVANAIYTSYFDFPSLKTSVNTVSNVTDAGNGTVTIQTSLTHGLTTGTQTTFTTPSGTTTKAYTVTVTGVRTFTIQAAVSDIPIGSTVNENPRNTGATIIDGPDQYPISWVNPLPQAVSVDIRWDSNEPAAINMQALQAVVADYVASYVNSVAAGAPLNKKSLDYVFLQAWGTLASTTLIDFMTITVSFDGVPADVPEPAQDIYGDPQSYFTCALSAVTIEHGLSETLKKGAP